MKDQAKKILKDSGFLTNKRHGNVSEKRIDKLTRFLENNCTTINETARVSIETNNNNDLCPKSKKAIAFENLGGVTGEYQLWAVIR